MTMGEREKRFLTLGAVSVIVFGALNWGVLPWADKLMDSGPQLVQAEKKLRQKKELLAAAPLTQAQLTQAEAKLADQEKRLLPAGDASQAGAQLQQWLSQRAAEQKLEVQRSDFLPVAPVSDDYVRVPVRLDLAGPITQVVQFMNAVTRGDRIVAVDELQISSTGNEKDKRVHCTVVISGLMAKAA
jgi:Tfp pilus assembly protein PilO